MQYFSVVLNCCYLLCWKFYFVFTLFIDSDKAGMIEKNRRNIAQEYNNTECDINISADTYVI